MLDPHELVAELTCSGLSFPYSPAGAGDAPGCVFCLTKFLICGSHVSRVCILSNTCVVSLENILSCHSFLDQSVAQCHFVTVGLRPNIPMVSTSLAAGECQTLEACHQGYLHERHLGINLRVLSQMKVSPSGDWVQSCEHPWWGLVQ